MTPPSVTSNFLDEVLSEALIDRLRRHLESELPRAQGVLLYLDSDESRDWRVVWSSSQDLEVRASQLQIPEQELDSQWRPLERSWSAGVLGVRLEPWASRMALLIECTQDLDDRDLHLLKSQASLGLYEDRDQAWKGAAAGLLQLFSRQRVAIGHQLHRGPAQGLTAARLEFSLLDPDILPLLEPIRRAVEDAGERLREIVHERLAPPAQGAQRQLEEEDPERLLGILEQEALVLESWFASTEKKGSVLGKPEEPRDGTELPSRTSGTQEEALAALWVLGGGMAVKQEDDVYRLLRF